MTDEAGMPLQPGTDMGMFVGAVIVQDEVKGSLTRKLPVQSSQKSQKLLMAVALVALADHPATQDFQRRE